MATQHIHTVFSKRNWIAVVIISLIPPVFFISSELVMGSGFEGDLPIHILSSTIFSFCITAVLFFGTTLILHRLHNYIPWQKHPVRRLLAEIFSILTYASTMMVIATIIFHQYFIPEVDFTQLLYSNLLIALTLTIIVTAIEEGRFFLNQWKESLVHSERLKKEMAESQYEALRNQVNPHFLFNSLNSLSALVHKDPDKAEKFIAEFSGIYRYVLEKNNVVVVTVREELKFLQSYFFLQQIRFGENLKFEVNLDPAVLDQYIPPMSLQLLAENAIKHNEISSANPLTVILSGENGFLVMKNNLQLRDEKSDSTGIGLKNLENRYDAISEMKPSFSASGKYFEAKIPLIKEP